MGVCLHLYDVCGCVCACACVCLCMHVCVCLMRVCLAFRVMLNGMIKVATVLLASSSSLGRPIGAIGPIGTPRVFQLEILVSLCIVSVCFYCTLKVIKIVQWYILDNNIKIYN